jgi:hypothetical protein
MGFWEEGKRFFFEKKKQKTFVHLDWEGAGGDGSGDTGWLFGFAALRVEDLNG